MALMDAAPQPEKPRSALATVLRFIWIIVLIAALYTGWIFYSRHERDKAAQEAIDKRKQEEVQRVNNLIFGSGEIKFTTLSADDGFLRRGQTTRLCYGVVNAVKLEIDPPVAQIKPTYMNCLVIAPKKTTTYTLKATDAKGNTKSESLTIQVQ